MRLDIVNLTVDYKDLHQALGLPDYIEIRSVEANQSDQSLTLILNVPSEILQHDAYGRPIPLDYTLLTPQPGLSLRGFIGNPAALAGQSRQDKDNLLSNPSNTQNTEPVESPATKRMRELLYETK